MGFAISKGGMARHKRAPSSADPMLTEEVTPTRQRIDRGEVPLSTLLSGMEQRTRKVRTVKLGQADATTTLPPVTALTIILTFVY